MSRVLWCSMYVLGSDDIMGDCYDIHVYGVLEEFSAKMEVKFM